MCLFTLCDFTALTYSSTVFHLTNGLRKLVRVNNQKQNNISLFRGIRGELPNEFWHEDIYGMVTATEFGFMSTSQDFRETAKFMDTKQNNILWELKCTAETSEGFHSGADVSLLSQYPEEQEILFPPLTMLTVMEVREDSPEKGAITPRKRQDNQPPASVRDATCFETVQPEPVKHPDQEAHFIRILVQPTFV